jgi:hypothetical protein
MLSTARGWLGNNQLDQIFNISAPKERFDGFLDVVRKCHGERGEVLASVFARMDRTDEIVRRRSFITNAEHRFFLALLMNLDGKENIFSLINQRYPGVDPVEKVLDWVFELSETRVMAANSSNALGIDGFDAFDLFVFENLLRDKSTEEMKESIKTDYPADQAENLTAALPEKVEKLRKAVIFQPFFDDIHVKTAAI